jgi:Membrane bound FAD containing D-sorbitol dehydrogenase
MEVSKDFLALSLVLTGEDSLDPTLSTAYLDRLNQAYTDDLSALITAFNNLNSAADVTTELDSLLDREQNLANTARQIIKVWYSGQFNESDGTINGPKTPEQYQSGLLWKIIKAHAPGYTNGTYGYWETAP